jgi:signal transduction histidine kinase
MRADDKNNGPTGAKGELLMLFLASLSVVVTLVVTLSDGGMNWIAGPQLRLILLLSVTAGLALLAIAMLMRIGTQRSVAQAANSETERLRRNLITTEAILKAEPQILIYWEHGEDVRVMVHTMTSVPGVPELAGEILRFGQWLDTAAAEDLKSGLDKLFADGTAFNLLLATRAGAHLEADGRVAAGRAILRLRDVAGYKRDVARVVDQHRVLTRDIAMARALFDALPMPIWMRNADGRLEWVNAAYARSVDVADGPTVVEHQVELLETRQRERVKKALQDGQPFKERTHIITGGERKAHDVVVMRHEQASAGAAIDVAAIEIARGELDRQVAAYDRTLHRVATGIAIFGPDQRLTFFNVAYRDLWQLDADWLGSHPTNSEILDRLRALSRLPETGNYRDWKARILKRSPTAGEYEDWWHLLDGRTIHVLSEQRPDGGVTFLFDDATERLALEMQFNALIGAQRETLDNLTEGVAVFATDGRLRLHNTAFAQIWRLSRATLAEGPHIDEIVAQCRVLHDDPRAWQRISQAVTGISDRRQAIEGQMQRPDGSVIDFSVSPLPDGATLICFSDVTDAKRYERALIERNEALVAADRLKSQFISHVSYELRTPLTNIIGFSELMTNPRTGDLNPKQREYLADISNSSKTLLAIINDILDLTTIDAGALELKLAPVEVRGLIESAVLGVRDRLTRARLTLDVRIADDVKEFIADEARVRQILYNLIANAIGFSSAGGAIRIGCWRDGAMIAFGIEDHGVGIPKDQQRRVFERFESRSHGSKHRGAGLGLSIVKSLTELHGGTWTLDSEPGRGTRVTIKLPEKGRPTPAASEPAANVA